MTTVSAGTVCRRRRLASRTFDLPPRGMTGHSKGSAACSGGSTTSAPRRRCRNIGAKYNKCVLLLPG